MDGVHFIVLVCIGKLTNVQFQLGGCLLQQTLFKRNICARSICCERIVESPAANRKAIHFIFMIHTNDTLCLLSHPLRQCIIIPHHHQRRWHDPSLFPVNQALSHVHHLLLQYPKLKNICTVNGDNCSGLATATVIPQKDCSPNHWPLQLLWGSHGCHSLQTLLAASLSPAEVWCQLVAMQQLLVVSCAAISLLLPLLSASVTTGYVANINADGWLFLHS